MDIISLTLLLALAFVAGVALRSIFARSGQRRQQKRHQRQIDNLKTIIAVLANNISGTVWKQIKPKSITDQAMHILEEYHRRVL